MSVEEADRRLAQLSHVRKRLGRPAGMGGQVRGQPGPGSAVGGVAGQRAFDLVFPGFFAVLLIDALAARPRLVPVALAAAAVAGVASRFLPGGAALLLAASAVLLTLVAHREPRAGQAGTDPSP